MGYTGVQSAELSHALATLPPIETWHIWLFAGVTMLALGLQARGGLSRRLAEWRIERALRRDPFAMQQELHAFRLTRTEDQAEFELAPALLRAAGAGAYIAAPFWLAGNYLEEWFDYLGFALPVLGLPFVIWRRLNDPEAGPLWRGVEFPEAHAPEDAVVGLLVGVSLAAVLLAMAFLLF